MKIKVKELVNALSIVKPGLAGKELLAQTTSFAFINGYVVTYNDEISIRHPVDELKIEGAIEADQFYSFLGRLKKEEVEMELVDNELILHSGRSKAGFRLEQEIKLPLDEIDMQTDWVKIPEKFLHHLDAAKNVCSRDMSRPMFTCVHVGKDGVIEASDSYRIYWSKVDDFKFKDFLLPATSVKVVVNLKPNKVAISDGWVHFKNENETIISCRIFKEKFADINKHLTGKGEQVKFPKDLYDVLQKAEVFSKRDFSLEEMVTLQISERKLNVSSKSDTGWYEEQLSMRYKGESFVFSVSPASLMNILEKTTNAYLNEKILLFEADDWKYVTVIVWGK